MMFDYNISTYLYTYMTLGSNLLAYGKLVYAICAMLSSVHT